MTDKKIAKALLQILTKQRFRDENMKDYLKENGYLSNKGNPTKFAKKFVFNYYWKK